MRFVSERGKFQAPGNSSTNRFMLSGLIPTPKFHACSVIGQQYKRQGVAEVNMEEGFPGVSTKRAVVKVVECEV